MEKEIKVIQLSDRKILEIVVPHIQRITKEQVLAEKAELENKLAEINNILPMFD